MFSPLVSITLNTEKTPFNLISLKVDTADYRDLSLFARNALTYVCGYLIKKKYS